MVCARNLHNWGAIVHFFTSFESDALGEVPTRQLHILDGLGVLLTLVSGTTDLPEADLLVDALIGYSLDGSPRGSIASRIRAANDAHSPRLALDTPAPSTSRPAQRTTRLSKPTRPSRSLCRSKACARMRLPPT
jgi:NAD(P)H-hydrate epimerase